jgi:hypothetical protein
MLPVAGLRGLGERRRQHYLRVRLLDEVNRLMRLPTSSTRSQQLHDELVAARDHAQVVRRSLLAAGVTPPSFEHLERSLGVLTRLTAVAAA